MTFHAMSRRAVPGAMVSISSSGDAAAVSAANLNESPIAAGFRRWAALRDSISFDISDNDLKRVYREMSKIVDAMLATPAGTPQEFAAQFMVVCSGDEIEYRQAARKLHAHAQALVGMSVQ
ncbi:hypothetical protein [Mesorhizobium sp.]|uniref:hypothetical protein n=1 Tax=Mesorhizobium sp. TaxID=1871066 RepID=UPI000FE2A0F9|nr:hypothetical protein [Mesorhizobium sp.]RWA75674.1 MAG: hypothetical protein EOQ28_08500 [Mesorhizobium sp.]RWB99719.1 MAG: hypothetical protein EOQ57_18350 [Mesorhizobium sp.]RWG82857.1 MAG: hypothetical protein EOQ69_15045 [Mesorhizobium sp.]RWG88089.1 MAG: hypothetical protein EOQ70_12670 [Mesorhizobium sp.]RWK05922.1 MAG: hypothetical protein EOR42_12810 [Mesorhizobium sp.]